MLSVSEDDIRLEQTQLYILKSLQTSGHEPNGYVSELDMKIISGTNKNLTFIFSSPDKMYDLFLHSFHQRRSFMDTQTAETIDADIKLARTQLFP